MLPHLDGWEWGRVLLPQQQGLEVEEQTTDENPGPKPNSTCDKGGGHLAKG